MASNTQKHYIMFTGSGARRAVEHLKHHSMNVGMEFDTQIVIQNMLDDCSRSGDTVTHDGDGGDTPASGAAAELTDP